MERGDTNDATMFVPGQDAVRGRVRGLLLHVEEIRAVRLLCSANAPRQEEVQPAPGRHVRAPLSLPW